MRVLKERRRRSFKLEKEEEKKRNGKKRGKKEKKKRDAPLAPLAPRRPPRPSRVHAAVAIDAGDAGGRSFGDGCDRRWLVFAHFLTPKQRLRLFRIFGANDGLQRRRFMTKVLKCVLIRRRLIRI